jgi:hypothetical protein
MAMNPRDAANAKGCIDAVISFTKTKLLPHVPEITIRFIQSVENRKFPMPLPLPQINFGCSRPTQYGESGRTIKYDRFAYQRSPAAVVLDPCLMAVERTHIDVVAGKKWSFTAAIHRRPASGKIPANLAVSGDTHPSDFDGCSRDDERPAPRRSCRQARNRPTQGSACAF